MHNEQELIFVKTFVSSDQRRRFTELLKTSKGRKRFIGYLAHSLKLNKELAAKIPASL